MIICDLRNPANAIQKDLNEVLTFSKESIRNLINDTKKIFEEQRMKLVNPNTIIEESDIDIEDNDNNASGIIEEKKVNREYSSSYSDLMSQ